jgi:Fic family protein
VIEVTSAVTPQREYERSHPWIDFSVDLSRASIQLWMLLGEAQSKVEHIAGVPLKPSVAARLHQLYLAKGVLATTAIEGNTLTEAEVLDIVEGKADIPPSKEYLKTEIENILRACNDMLPEIQSGNIAPLTPDLICEYNRMVLRGLDLGDPKIQAGEIRQYPVVVGRYRAAPAPDCHYLLERLCEWLNGTYFDPPSARWALAYAVIKAAIAHLYIAWIHPFGDGNGRTARLAEFRILVSSGLSSPAAHILSDHYNQTRSEYYRQLEQSSRGTGDEATFLLYAVQGLVDGLKQQLELIQEQQLVVMWHDYVYEILRGPGAVEHRRRTLVFALSGLDNLVTFEEIPVLAPLASAYAARTTRTLARDLSALVKVGLVERTSGGYRARRESILAFLPLRHRPQASGPAGV